MTSSEKEIRRFQENLRVFRKLGGWTTQELGDMVGVTKQTISNLETKASKMSKIQYIALRSVLENEANSDSKNAELLQKALLALLDDSKSDEEYADAEKQIGLAAAALSGGASVEAAMGLITAVPIAAGATVVAAAVAPAIVPAVAPVLLVGTWLSRITKNKK